MDRWLFTWSLVEKEYTLNVHPLTRVTYPRILKRTEHRNMSICNNQQPAGKQYNSYMYNETK